jgi:hypothetical protein
VRRLHLAFILVFIAGCIGLGGLLVALPPAGGGPRSGGFVLLAVGSGVLLLFRRDLLGRGDGGPPSS